MEVLRYTCAVNNRVQATTAVERSIISHTKINQIHMKVIVNHNILWFDIFMQNITFLEIKKDINYLKNKNFPYKTNILNIIEASGQFTNKNQFLEKLNQDNKKNNYLLHLHEAACSIQKQMNSSLEPIRRQQ